MTQRPPVRDDLASLDGYHSPQVEVAIRLNTNESPEPPPDGFAEAVEEAVGQLAWHRYPDRAATVLREGIAARHGLDAAQVFAANGSNEVLQTLLLAFGGPGRKAVTFEPTYAMHGHIARITGTEVVEGERDDHFEVDRSAALDLVQQVRPAITFLCSPNNPSGNPVAADLLAAMHDFARDSGSLLVVDEAYGEFAPRSALELFSEDANLAITRTFSKTWSMAAARLGYAIAPSWLIERLYAVVLPYHLDAMKQTAGSIALDFASEMNARVGRIVANRETITRGFETMGVEYWPSASNFILFRPHIDGEVAAGVVWEGLLQRGILVRNCATWPRLEGCLRVTVGTSDENQAFLTALAEILTTNAPTTGEAG